MGECINIYKVRARLLLMFMAVLLVGCSDDSDRVDGETDVLQLVPYTRGLEDVSSSVTRAVTLPNDYSAYYGPNSIGVYTTTASEAPTQVRTFSYVHNAWNSQVNVTNTTQYYIYGYMPVNDTITCAISELQGSNGYEDGAVLSFTGLPPVMAGDFSVITGVQQVSSATPTESVSLTAGNFSYQGRASGQNFVCLMLDHLYSCVRFKFLVDGTYSKLRTIKLKKVELKTETQYSYPLTVTLRQRTTPEPTGYEPYSIQWGNSVAMSSGYAMLFTSEDGELLTTDKTVDGYFAPFADIANYLVLKCTYDVYDEEGNRTREDCEAENKLPVDKIVAEFNKRTTLTLTVNPTYLYVLSEPDLDNPTIEVKSE